MNRGSKTVKNHICTQGTMNDMLQRTTDNDQFPKPEMPQENETKYNQHASINCIGHKWRNGLYVTTFEEPNINYHHQEQKSPVQKEQRNVFWYSIDENPSVLSIRKWRSTVLYLNFRRFRGLYLFLFINFTRCFHSVRIQIRASFLQRNLRLFLECWKSVMTGGICTSDYSWCTPLSVLCPLQFQHCDRVAC